MCSSMLLGHCATFKAGERKWLMVVGRPFYEDILCKCKDDNLLQIPIVRKKLGI